LVYVYCVRIVCAPCAWRVCCFFLFDDSRLDGQTYVLPQDDHIPTLPPPHTHTPAQPSTRHYPAAQSPNI
jgi:hypothetical protein